MSFGSFLFYCFSSPFCVTSYVPSLDSPIISTSCWISSPMPHFPAVKLPLLCVKPFLTFALCCPHMLLVPVLQSEFSIPQVSFCYLDSFTVTSVIKINGPTKLVINSQESGSVVSI